MTPPDYLSDIPPEILLNFFNHLDLSSIFRLRRAGKKIKEKTDTVLSSTVTSYIDLQKASQLHPNKPYTYRYFRRYPEIRKTGLTFPFSSSVNSARIKSILSEFSKLKNSLLKQLEEYREFIKNRIIYYLENNNFTENELESFEKAIKWLIPQILSSKELMSTMKDDKLFLKILMILHNAIKHFQKEEYDSFNNFLSNFISYLTTFSDMEFLADLLTEDQICSLLREGYILGKKYKETNFFNLFREIAIITGSNLTADLLFFLANFIGSTQLQEYAVYLIPAIINFYQEEPIVTIEAAEKAFIAMGLKESVLSGKIIILSDCLVLLYHKNILKNIPTARQNSRSIFLFLKNLTDTHPSITRHMIMDSINAMVVFFKEESRPKISLEIVFLFDAGKLFFEVEPLAETLILIKKTPQANITTEMIETWVVKLQQTTPKEYYKKFGSRLIYNFTKAILALYRMHQLDDKGEAIEKLKKLTFKENATPQTEVIEYLKFFFDNRMFYPELGVYLLNSESPLPKQNVARFILELINHKILPIPISFEEFMKYAASLSNEKTNEQTNKHLFYFQQGLLQVLSHTLFKQNLVKQEIKDKLFKAAISLIHKHKAQPYLNGIFIAHLLELYLFSLYFEIPKSLDEVATHFNYDSHQMGDKIHFQFYPLIKVNPLSFPLIKQVVTILLQIHFSNEDFEKLIFMAKVAPEEVASDLFSQLIKCENQENLSKIMQQIEVFVEPYLNDSSDESKETSDEETSDNEAESNDGEDPGSSFHI